MGGYDNPEYNHNLQAMKLILKYTTHFTSAACGLQVYKSHAYLKKRIRMNGTNMQGWVFNLVAEME